MKIVSIVSSYRTNGNTEQVVKQIENYLVQIAAQQSISMEIEHISLNKEDIQLCRGCRACFEKGEQYCPIKDSILKIRNEIVSADGIVIASPVYVEDVNGLMKNWIDRMAFHCHRPAFYGKYAAIITTSGAGSSNHSINTLKNALTVWGFYIGSKRNYRMGAKMEAEQIQTNYGANIESVARKLFNAINDKKAKRPSLYSLVTFRILQRCYRKTRNHETVDYVYWNDHGWLDLHKSYYGDHDSNWVKGLLARIIGYLVSLFFI